MTRAGSAAPTVTPGRARRQPDGRQGPRGSPRCRCSTRARRRRAGRRPPRRHGRGRTRRPGRGRAAGPGRPRRRRRGRHGPPRGQRRRRHPAPLGIVAAGTGNDIARRSRAARRRPGRAAAGRRSTLSPGAARDRRGALHRRRRHRAADDVRWFAGVLGAGFDAVVNERANGWRWPRGPPRYDLAIARELPVVPAARVPAAARRRPPRHGRACSSRSRNGPSYGGGMHVCPDALFDDGLLDVLRRRADVQPGVRADLPEGLRRAPTSPTRGAHRARLQVEIACAGIVGVRRRGADAAAAADRRVRPGRAAAAGPGRPWVAWGHEHAGGTIPRRPAGRAVRAPAAQRRAGRHPLGAFRGRVPVRPRPLPGAGLRGAPGRPRRARRRPDRARARRSSASSPSTWPWPPAARPSTRRRSRRCRTRSTPTWCAATAPGGRPAHRRQHRSTARRRSSS